MIDYIIIILMGIGDWGLGIGDWGLGIGPNPQSPIPNPQSPYLYYIITINIKILCCLLYYLFYLFSENIISYSLFNSFK